MNRLWVRLAVSIMISILATTFIAEEIAVALYFNNDYLLNPLIKDLERDDGLLVELANYHIRQGSWEGIASFLESSDNRIELEAYWSTQSFAFAFYDADHQLLYDTLTLDKTLATDDLIKEIPIVIAGETQGYIGIRDTVAVESAFTADYQSRFNTLDVWLRGIILILVALIISVIVSLSLATSLRQLASEVQQFSLRNLHLRLQERSSTEIRAVARAFNTMADALEKAEKARRNMVADVAHELRTPLSLIQGNLRAILDGVYPLEQREILQVYDQTRLLARLVNDLHELAQADVRPLPLTRQNASLPVLIQEAVGAFLPATEEQQIVLQAEIDENLPPLSLDRERIKQVLHNLVGNALRHSSPGGSITIAAHRLKDTIRLQVADTGEGIPQEHQPHIFDRFYRVDEGRSRSKGGVGLGLAITRAIIEAHGGTITVQSQPHDTRFTILLPTA